MKLTNIKLIATDLDGTILEHGQISNSKDLQMLKKAAQQQIAVAVVTGQGWSSGSTRAKMFDVDQHLDISIFSNGAVIGKVSEFDPIYCETISPQIVHTFVKKMTELNIAVLAFSKVPGHCYWNGISIEVVSLKQRNWIDKYTTQEIDAKKFMDYQSVVQLMIFVEAKQEVDMLEWFGLTKMDMQLNSMRSNVESTPIYEFINLKANKGKGVIQLANMLKIDINDVLVFGDNLNDLSMFEMIPNSVAMGNSVDAIKKKAKYLTDTNLNGGVGQFIEKYILKE